MRAEEKFRYPLLIKELLKIVYNYGINFVRNCLKATLIDGFFYIIID